MEVLHVERKNICAEVKKDSLLRIIEENADRRHVLYFKEYQGRWIARTLRDAAKSVEGANFFKTIKENMDEEIDRCCNKAIEWKKMVMIVRMSWKLQWRLIKEKLSSKLPEIAEIIPFRCDRAFIRCTSIKGAEKIGDLGTMVIEDKLSVMFAPWHPEHTFLDRKLVSTGGWIGVEGLPPCYWTKEILKLIGDECGGLMEISKATSNLRDLSMARIKVNGGNSGYIPESMEIKVKKEAYIVYLKVLTKPRRLPERKEVHQKSLIGRELPVNQNNNGSSSCNGETSHATLKENSKQQRNKDSGHVPKESQGPTTNIVQLKPTKVHSEGQVGEWLGRVKAKRMEDFKVWEIKNSVKIGKPNQQYRHSDCILRNNEDNESASEDSIKNGRDRVSFRDIHRGYRVNTIGGNSIKEKEDRRYGQTYIRRSNKREVQSIDQATEKPDCYEEELGEAIGPEWEEFQNVVVDSSEVASEESENEGGESSDEESQNSEEALYKMGGFFNNNEEKSLCNDDHVSTLPGSNHVNNFSSSCPNNMQKSVHLSETLPKISSSDISQSSFIPNSVEGEEGENMNGVSVNGKYDNIDHEEYVAIDDSYRPCQNDAGVTLSSNDAFKVGEHEGFMEKGESHDQIKELEQEINALLKKLNMKLLLEEEQFQRACGVESERKN
ncbi:hypothetical protein LguiA_002998 [Lonicera macranthoides]